MDIAFTSWPGILTHPAHLVARMAYEERSSMLEIAITLRE
jgi:hypothetical protein